ncbi:STAS domain-containing protein [Thermodesulfobacteriota bacterium]
MSLKVTSRQKAPGLFIVSLDGSLKYDTCSVLEEEIGSILDTSSKMVVLDMDHLKFLSSAGVREIMKAKKAMKEKDGEISFMNLQPQVKKVLEIINLIPAMQNFKSLEELDEYFKAM